MILFNYQSLFNNAMLVLCYSFVTLCQAYENIALNKTAYQKNQYEKGNNTFDASNAVDGLKSDLRWSGGQCAVSATSKETATWWVDLGSINSIHHITIYYRTENQNEISDYRNSFLGFSLYVSNTTNRLQGTLCFKDDYFNRSTIPAVFNTTCQVHGQYVIYYNERLHGVSYPSDYNEYAENDLCEVEVYGCPIHESYFGNCLVSNTMTCQCSKCKPGFFGRRCEFECDVGHYGYNCNETCGHCIDPRQCSNVKGTCLSGCKAGYSGQTCKEDCIVSQYGYNCNETCGHCKDPIQCSAVTGTCLTRCNAGYVGRLCKEECVFGHYGYNCNETCGHCKDPIQCSTVSGTCLTGCKAGYVGRLCKEVCVFGYYGHGCIKECSKFCNRSRDCNPVSGFCNGGCRNGKKGGYCQEDRSLSGRTIEFYCFIGALGLSTIVIVVLIICIILKRRNNKHQERGHEQLRNTVDIPVAYHVGGACGEYIEFREGNTDNPYDRIQERSNVRYNK
ncbi:multiple epidermal growth factor-like domains protein 10 isoform X1 [Crassostrea angulata]|uniref:multiple epidermal growth factor-like domains protein 10 isoform X1 n=1 Tax=Magallana angulata TaxID=2784310 RepID=UPI0022B1A51D|nr:multiple epidermal growth factor-like domains protein 10 isoform X1 [Crassostrea angulata]